MLSVSFCNLKILNLVSFLMGGDFQFQCDSGSLTAKYFLFYDCKFIHSAIDGHLPNFLPFYLFCLLKLFCNRWFPFLYITSLDPVSVFLVYVQNPKPWFGGHAYVFFILVVVLVCIHPIIYIQEPFLHYFSPLGIMKLKTFANLMGVRWFLVLLICVSLISGS